MELINECRDNKGTFTAVEKGVEVGAADYFYRSADCIVVEHVNVKPEMKGQGVGKVIVMMLVDWARENGVKITPWCSFAKTVFDRNESIHDVLRREGEK